MQLHVARLCLDCEEVHDAHVCPRCTSESFAFLSRWISAPERRARPRMEEPEHLRAIAQLSETPAPRSRWLKRGAVLAAVGLGSWLWSQKGPKPASRDDSRVEKK